MIDLIKECSAAQNIGISGHIRPDGDCIGSTLSLCLYLRKVFPEKRVDLFLEPYAEAFQDVEGIDAIDHSFQGADHYDVYFCVDCGKDRLGDAEALFDAAEKTINIDHHISNKNGCGDVNYVEPEASSASELVFDLLDPGYIDAKIAAAIYMGIVHDTGIFQYSSTSPKTMRIAAQLMEYGFDFSQLIDKTFNEKTYHQDQIMGRALLESILFMDGKCIFSAIDHKTMEFYDVCGKDMEGIVSRLRETKGVECAIFMYEYEPLTYKVSLRSCGKVDVAKVAAIFGGGGHVRAAGCTINGTVHDVINNLSVHIEKQLEG